MSLRYEPATQSGREREAQRGAEEHAAERVRWRAQVACPDPENVVCPNPANPPARWRAQEERLSALVRVLEADKHTSDKQRESDKHRAGAAPAGGRRQGGVVAGLEVDYVRVKDKLSELQTRLSKEGLRAAKAELALTKARKVRGSLFAWKRYLN